MNKINKRQLTAMLSEYRKSPFSADLSFYEYASLILKAEELRVISQMSDQARIDESMFEHFGKISDEEE